jgi:SAM-dependent methyltransferase
MGQEIDLLISYPRQKRDVEARGSQKTEDDRALARNFGKDFFDGDRRCGYGGFHYNPRFWQPVIPTVQEHFGLGSGFHVLDVGCAKGFMLFDLITMIPGLTVRGVDISAYAIEHALDPIKPYVQVGDAQNLPFSDQSFDVVISINTIHNLERDECAQALREIQRVAKKGAFITVDAYRSDDEKERMFAWNLTAKTIMHVEEWKEFFTDVGYTGDYYWFIP